MMSGKRSFGSFMEPVYSCLSSLWHTAFTLPFLAGNGSGRQLTTEWLYLEGKRRAQLLWQISRHCIDFQCLALWWAGRTWGRVLCAYELFLEGHLGDWMFPDSLPFGVRLHR